MIWDAREIATINDLCIFSRFKHGLVKTNENELGTVVASMLTRQGCNSPQLHQQKDARNTGVFLLLSKGNCTEGW